MFLILLELIKNLKPKNPNKSPIKAKKCKKIFIRKSKNGKDIKRELCSSEMRKAKSFTDCFFLSEI